MGFGAPESENIVSRQRAMRSRRKRAGRAICRQLRFERLEPLLMLTAAVSELVNGGSPNRSGVAELGVNFDLPVTIASAAALRVINHTTGNEIDLSTATLQGNGTSTVLWDLSSIDLPDGRYTAELRSDVASSASDIPLDQTFVFEFFVLRGDANGDGVVNFADYGEISRNFDPLEGAPYRAGDTNGDARVNFADYREISANFNPLGLPDLEYDFGDAPGEGTNYPTTRGDGGAIHVLGSELTLGSAVDSEDDGQPDPDALGDDNADSDDEDGVSFGTLVAGTQASVNVTATVPLTAVLNAWFDFNGDGDWNDEGEQIFVDTPIKDGVNQLDFSVPDDATGSYARFRISSTPGYSFAGLAADGEVEDYRIPIAPQVIKHLVNRGSANRSGVSRLGLDFDQDVTISAPTALHIYNHSTGVMTDLALVTMTGNGTSSLTWDLSSLDLPDGRYTVELPAADVINTEGDQLAATHAFEFFVLKGDASGDGVVNFGDYGIISANFDPLAGEAYRSGDTNGDGRVNFADYGVISAHFNPLGINELNYDFGDAPSATTQYPTTLEENGALHVLSSGPYLGASIDSEIDGQPHIAANVDDTNGADDEDGVTFDSITDDRIDITVVATVPATAVLNAWFDFNGDGDWSDVGEQIFTDLPILDGPNSLSFPVPANFAGTHARFRITSGSGYGFAGLAPDGEVEDYRIPLALELDLDASSDGSDYSTAANAIGKPVNIVDTDVEIESRRQLVRATVTLSNPSNSFEESLNVDAAGLPTGITLDPASTATELILTSSGSSSEDFEAALRQITYNLSSDPFRVTNGLVVLYDLEEGSGTTVHDVSGVGTPLDLTIADPESVSWIPGGLSLDSPTIVSSLNAASKVHDAISATGSITIEAWLQPDLLDQGGTPPARILTLSEDPSARNFSFGQYDDHYNVRLRTSSTNVNGDPPTDSSNIVQTTELAHVVYTRDAAGVTKIYVDGQLETTGSTPGDLSNWDADYALALGNELTLDRPWLGDLQLVSVYDRALTLGEVQQNFGVGANPDLSERMVHVVVQDNAAADSNTGVTRINIEPANRPPNAVSHSYLVLQDTTASFPAAVGLLNGATDPESEPLVISAVDSSGTAGGTISNVDLVTGAFTYTPPSGFVGVDSFNYTISDSNEGFDTATVTISIVTGAPELNLDSDNSGGNSPNYAALFNVEQGAPVNVADHDLTISDVDSPNLASATVTITNRQDGSNEILMASASGAIDADDITYDSATGVLTISPPSGASLKDFEEVLQSITYDNTSATPTTGVERLVSFVVSDGPHDSQIRTSNVMVTSIPAAFPGAVGFGATATGGRGGDVYHVTNLDDYDSGQPAILGSFRYGIESKTGPRTIVFDLGGNIELKRSLFIETDDLTIAGQSAPGDGITFWGYGIKVIASSNIIVRSLRFRVGDFHAEAVNQKPGKGNMDLPGEQADPFEIGWSDRIIVDHVSATWGIDETLTVWESTNVTVQNSILAESLNDSYHIKGPHGYGTILRSRATPADRANGVGGITFYGNLLAKHDRRSPAFNNGPTSVTDIEFVNNVVYNWGNQAGHAEEAPSTFLDVRINYVGNYLVAGPSTQDGLIGFAVNEFGGNGTRLHHGGTTFMDIDKDGQHDGTAVGDEAFTLFNAPLEATAFNFPLQGSSALVTAEQAYERVLNEVGDYVHRDFHDQRLIDELVNRTGQILDSQDELIGLYGIAHPITPLDPGTAPIDDDGDGMPNDWEISNGLDPANAADRNGFAVSNNGYTNLEVYLNSLFVSAGASSTQSAISPGEESAAVAAPEKTNESLTDAPASAAIDLTEPAPVAESPQILDRLIGDAFGQALPATATGLGQNRVPDSPPLDPAGEPNPAVSPSLTTGQGDPDSKLTAELTNPKAVDGKIDGHGAFFAELEQEPMLIFQREFLHTLDLDGD